MKSYVVAITWIDEIQKNFRLTIETYMAKNSDDALNQAIEEGAGNDRDWKPFLYSSNPIVFSVEGACIVK